MNQAQITMVVKANQAVKVEMEATISPGSSKGNATIAEQKGTRRPIVSKR